MALEGFGYRFSSVPVRIKEADFIGSFSDVNVHTYVMFKIL